MLQQIRETSRDGLVICFAGVGSAFAKKNAQTSMIIAKNGVTVLVDLGQTVPMAMAEKGIKATDFDFYHFTHSHADHIGGLEELFLTSRYVSQRKPKIIITDHYQDILWEKSLKGGCEYNEVGMLRFSDFAEPIRPEWMKSQPREMYHVNVCGIDLVIFRTIHIPGGVHIWEKAFWSTGVVVDNKVLFSADTRFDPSIFVDLEEYMDSCSAIFHDCQLFSPGSVHASYDELCTLPNHLRNKMYLTHYGDNFGSFHPEKDGFLGFAEAWKIYHY